MNHRLLTLLAAALAQGLAPSASAEDLARPAAVQLQGPGLAASPGHPAGWPPAREIPDATECARIRQELGLARDGSLCLTVKPSTGSVTLFLPLDASRPEEVASVAAGRLQPAVLDARPGGDPGRLELEAIGVDGVRLDPRYEKLARHSVYLAGMGAAVMGTMIVMPPSVSKWNTVDRAAFVGAMPSEWSGHVSQGPIVDVDEWAVNYIGHPISGSFYYQIARHDGFGVLGSTLYSALMSTFFWEYGIEAFAEIPSVQDIVVTPLGGALLGEAFFQAEQALDRNGGTVFGSRILGETARVLLNPAGALVNGLDWMLVSPANPSAPQGRGLSAHSTLVAYQRTDPSRPQLRDNYLGVQLVFTLP